MKLCCQRRINWTSCYINNQYFDFTFTQKYFHLQLNVASGSLSKLVFASLYMLINCVGFSVVISTVSDIQCFVVSAHEITET